MKYPFILLLFLQVHNLVAQPEIGRLGTLKLGVTTTDSLNKDIFREEEQSYVKGTIALPCAHIRSFKAIEMTVEQVVVKNVFLYFYDNRLFKLSCDYTNELEKIVQRRYGPGHPEAIRTVVLCGSESRKPMQLEGTSWRQEGTRALVIRSKGYTNTCQLEEKRRLDIADLPVLALASDCELRNAEPFVDEFAAN